MKKTFFKFAMLTVAAPLLFSNCASLFSKSIYPITINSNPNGATVTVTDKKGTEVFKGQSPATVTLKASSGFFARAQYQVKISMQGYAEQIVPVNFKVDGWYWGNLFIGGILGMLIIDPATGAMYKLDTPPINVTLNKSTASIETPTLKIIDIANVPKEMKEKLIRLK